MSLLARTAVELAKLHLRSETGLPFAVADVAQRQQYILPPLLDTSIVATNIASDVLEKSAGASYPRVHVYCEKISNSLREKFRSFSGTLRLTAEVRVSQDRVEDLETQLLLYVEAVTEVLESQRGDWGQGIFYGGGYDIVMQPIKHGGRNFIQSAKVTFELEASID